jgi:hypothetical protein
MEALYNDTLRTADERLSLYDGLFARDFIFYLQQSDVELGLPPSWGVETEREALNAIFTGLDKGEIYSLLLAMTHDPAQDLDPPQPGRESWKEIFVSSVHLRIMFSSEDGLEVNGGQAEFLFPPPVAGRWYVGEWKDMPRPEPERVTVEPTTFGQIKALYLP